MGGSSWSRKDYDDRTASRTSTGTPAFAYTAAVASGRTAAKVHDKLNPHGVKFRESRDSDVHPESLAIGVFFDVTGSMHRIPQVLQTKLAALMSVIIQKGYVAHPQVLFGAIGDAHSDHGPLQVGQFESGIEMEDDLTLFWLEGGGGGQMCETYELAYYFMANHTAIDCWEKRQKKGYVFTIGDEAPYETIRKAHIQKLLGYDVPSDMKTTDIIAALQARYHVFHIIAEDGGYPHDAYVEKAWRDLLGQHVLLLEDSNNVAELIAGTIGLTEGAADMDSVKDDLASEGATKHVIDTVTTTLARYAKSAGVLAKPGTASTLPDGGVAVDRL